MEPPRQPREEGEGSTLSRVRRARQLGLADVAAGLVRVLELPGSACPTVERHYTALEDGRLDPAGVAATVWAALATLLAPPGESAAAAETEVVEGDADVLGRAITDYSIAHRREPLGPAAVERLFGVTAPSPSRQGEGPA